MKQNIRRKTSERKVSDLDSQLPEIESYLETNFRPITPRADFVRGLKSRLADPAYVYRSPKSTLYFVVFVVSAIAATSLIVAVAVKLLVLLADSLRIVNLFSQQVEEKKSSPA